MHSIQHLWDSRCTFYLRKCYSDLTYFFPPRLFPKGFFQTLESLPVRSKDKSRLIVCQWARFPPCLIMNTLSSSKKMEQFSAYRALRGTCYTGLWGGLFREEGWALHTHFGIWQLISQLIAPWVSPSQGYFQLGTLPESTPFPGHPVEPRDTKMNIRGGPEPLTICQIMKEKGRNEARLDKPGGGGGLHRLSAQPQHWD